MPAHISLFHHLPGAELDRVEAVLGEVCAAMRPFQLLPAGPIPLGRGVAIRYESEALAHLHKDLARRFAAWLTPQDRQPFKAHVTIQNKVDPTEARALLARLTATDAPACRVEGVTLWRYGGGPWERVAICRFAMAQ